MLTKQRQELILELLKKNGSITVTQIRDLLEISESTIRRDITALHQEGKLVKVFGGAVAVEHNVQTHEYTVAQKLEMNCVEKQRIAQYAASLIMPEDFVYLDAGTTTAHMLEYIYQPSVTFVTNAVAHAKRLAMQGMKVLLIGGELKGSTEAVVGSQAIQMLQNYHFTKGFFGTNGVTKNAGCTTPDVNEAMVKRTAMKQCKKSYVLCDSSKFDYVSSVTFSPFGETTILTEREIAGYEKCDSVLIVSQE